MTDPDTVSRLLNPYRNRERIDTVDLTIAWRTLRWAREALEGGVDTFSLPNGPERLDQIAREVERIQALLKTEEAA